jgi:plastocyanin
MSRTRRAFLVLAAVATIASGACGGDDDADESGTDAAGDSAGDDAATTPAEGEDGGDTAEPGTVSIRDFTFTPKAITVKAGETVTWQNNDGFAHTATATDKSVFDSGNLDEGATFEHTFDTPGTFEYACSIHGQMTGSVVVE